ncbi:hypothetical protein D6817_05365, partial [Candidatus Pacearchaeota archaeon]
NATLRDLAAGTYNYRWYANDTLGNLNNSETGSYTINKAVPSGTITGTTPITYGTAADVQGSENNNGDADLSYALYRNNVSVSNPDTSVLGAGTYTYVYNTTGGQNYTSNSSLDEFTLTVNPAQSKLNLTLDGNAGNVTVSVGATVNITAYRLQGEGQIKLYNNGSLINQGDGPLENLTTFDAVGVYNITVVYEATQNYTSSSETHFVIVNDTTAPRVALLNPPNASVVGSAVVHFYAEFADDVSLANATLYVWNSTRGLVGTNFTSLTGSQNASNLSISLPYEDTFFWNYLVMDINANSAMNESNFTLTFSTADTQPPSITIHSPKNITYHASDFPLLFNVSLSEQGNAWYSLDGGATNITMSSADGVHFNASNDAMASGQYTFIAYGNDSAGNENSTSVTFSVVLEQNLPPTIVLNSPANASATTENFVILNATVFDETNTTVIFYGNGKALEVFSNVQNSTTLLLNWTSLSTGEHEWYVVASDGEMNSTSETRVFYISSEPVVRIASPSYASVYRSNLSLSLNFSVNALQLDSCWYTLDGGQTNVTLASCSNSSFNVSGNGRFVLELFANESLGGVVGSDSTEFFVALNRTTILLQSPEHESFTNSTFVDFIFIPNDDVQVENCSLYGDFGGSYKLNTTILSPQLGAENNISLELTDGNYTWAISCVNSENETSFTGNRTFIIDSVPPEVDISSPQNGNTYDVSPGQQLAIPLTFTVQDTTRTTCKYTLNFTILGIGDVSLSVPLPDCSSSQIETSIPGSYVLVLSAQDQASNSNSGESQFSVQFSSGSPGSSGSSGGGGGG